MAIEEVTSAQLEALKTMQKRVRNPKARERSEEKHRRTDYNVLGEDGYTEFKIYKRQNIDIPPDFSCGIRWLMPSGETLTLARYNGPSHIHGDIKYTPHIHVATEDAIQKGRKPESHAAATNRYDTVEGALHCLMEDFNVTGLSTTPDEPRLF